MSRDAAHDFLLIIAAGVGMMVMTVKVIAAWRGQPTRV